MPVALTNISSITPSTSPLVVSGSLNLTGAGVGYQVNGVALITGLGVQHGATAVGTQPAINFTDTASTTWTITNNVANNRIDISAVSTGAGYLADVTTTLGDLIVRGAAAVTRLGVGTNGQVLESDSTATLGVHWATLSFDATEIDLNPTVGTWTTVQAAVAGLNTHAPASVLTTLGDLMVRSATVPTRLGVGTNGQVLEADSASTLGVHWATISFDATEIDLNPTVGTWTTVQQAVAGLNTNNPASVLTTLGDILVRSATAPARLGVGANDQVLTADSTATNGIAWKTPPDAPEDILTTKGDILGFTTVPARIPVGATNNHVFMVDSATTSGVKWAAMTADLVSMNPTLNTTWTTVQNSITAISTALTTLARGMAYVGHYHATTDVATFVPPLNSLDGPLPAANATGIEEGDYLVVTVAGTHGTLGALNVGDQLISTGTAAWTVLPIGANLATVTAATVPLAPDLNGWGTVQTAITSLNTRATAAGAAGQIQYNGGGTPAGFAANANLFWDTANSRLGVNTAAPAYALHVVGAINCTTGLYVNGVLFAEPGSAHLRATSITGLDGEPLELKGTIVHNGKEIELDALLARLEKLESRLSSILN